MSYFLQIFFQCTDLQIDLVFPVFIYRYFIPFMKNNNILIFLSKAKLFSPNMKNKKGILYLNKAVWFSDLRPENKLNIFLSISNIEKKLIYF